MRRSKNEVIRSTLSSYLKRRRFSENEPCSSTPAPHTCTGSQMVLMTAVGKEIVQPNTILLGSVSTDVAQADMQFTRLKNWVAELRVDSCRYELAALLCPMFCHLYLEMLAGAAGVALSGQRQLANKFFKRHQAVFAAREHSRDLVEEVARVSCGQDVDDSPLVKGFRSSKYQLKLSSQAMVCLQKYFRQHKHLILLQVLQTWLDIEVMGTASRDQEEEEMVVTTGGGEVAPPQCQDDANGTDSLAPDTDGMAELQELQKTIQQVRASSPAAFPLLLYQIMNGANNISCSACSAHVSMIAAGVGSTVRLWDLTNCKLSAPPAVTIPLASDHMSAPPPCSPDRSSVVLGGHRGAVEDLAILAGTDYPSVLVSVAQDTKMRSWRLSDFTCAAVYSGHNGPIWCVDSSSLDLYVATGSQDCTTRIWMLDRTFPLRTLVGHSQPIESVRFHPNNLYIATGSADKTVRLWSLNDTSLLRLFPGYRGGIQAMAFSPSGKYLATGDEKRVKVWDLAASALFREFKGHAQRVVDLSWSRNNEYVASCSLDGTVRLWNLLDGSSSECSSSSGGSSSSSVLRMHTIGGARPLSLTHSYSNILVCVALA